MRPDGRAADALRPVVIETGAQTYPDGSALVSFGDTRVLCAATVEEGVPRWRRGAGRGWLTAEYAMLPGATAERSARDSTRGRVGGRTHEIQRLVGRSLRSVLDMDALGEHTVWVDCDVVQADGGTRTAAVTGAWVALSLALDALAGRGATPTRARLDQVAAVSVGVVDGEPRLDLCYAEDVRAQVDMNVVMAGDGRLVEVQGTAEGDPFPRAALDELLDLAVAGCGELLVAQREAAAR